MTREEALQILDTIPTIGEQVDALEMAIKALEQEPILDKIRSETEQIADEERKHDEKWAKGLRYAVKIIDKYRAGGSRRK